MKKCLGCRFFARDYKDAPKKINGICVNLALKECKDYISFDIAFDMTKQEDTKKE